MSERAGRMPLELPGSGSARLFGDDSLARRAAGGDQRAFAAIYRRHHQELYRYCRTILDDPDDAQDALQATMVKALRSLPGEHREIALKPWLFRIAHNEAISVVRARRGTTALDSEQPDPRPAVEQQVATRARLRELVRDLDDLPERQRGSLVMRELSGLSFEEIGRAFEVGPASAKQAVYEARVALQEIAEGREMDCDLVREAISAHDRRVLRGRRIRAHLRGCHGCRDFETAIGRRRSELAAIAPPLAVPAALATLQAVFGGGPAGGGAVAAGAGATAAGAGVLGGLGAGLGGGAAVKTAIAVLAAATVAGGAAGLSGVVDPGGSLSRPTGAKTSAPPASDAPHSSSPARPSSAPAPAGDAAGSRSRAVGHSHADGSGHGHGHGNSGGAGRSDQAPGNSAGQGQASAPGQTATPGNSPAAPHGQSGTAPGQSGTPPGQSGSAGSQASASGQARGGGTATAPGQTDTAPGQSGTAGNSADAPGQDK